MKVECENLQNLEIEDGGRLFFMHPPEMSSDFDEILHANID